MASWDVGGRVQLAHGLETSVPNPETLEQMKERDTVSDVFSDGSPVRNAQKSPAFPNHRIPPHIRELTPYVAGKSLAEIQESLGLSRIAKLASNENRLGCSPAVGSAVQEALRTIHDYPDPIARALRRVLAEDHAARHGWALTPEHVIIASGSESILAILCRTFLEEGDEVVTSDATFVGFYVQAGVMGARIIRTPSTPDWRFDVEAMIAAIGPKTKMVYLANPNNPTGTMIGVREYRRLLEAIPSDVLFIVDEAYYEYAQQHPDYPHALRDLPAHSNLVVLRTFSKAFGLAGLRVGYGFATPDLIALMLKTKLTFEPTATGQAAALAAWRDREFLARSVELVERERAAFEGFLADEGVRFVHSQSNSVMLVCASAEDAERFTQAMLEEGVILRRVQAFGLPTCIRVTIGLPDEMAHFREAFHTVNSKLRLWPE